MILLCFSLGTSTAQLAPSSDTDTLPRTHTTPCPLRQLPVPPASLNNTDCSSISSVKKPLPGHPIQWLGVGGRKGRTQLHDRLDARAPEAKCAKERGGTGSRLETRLASCIAEWLETTRSRARSRSARGISRAARSPPTARRTQPRRSAARRPTASMRVCARASCFGLYKRDVDLKRRLLTVRRSYDNDTTKGAREKAVPIAPGWCRTSKVLSMHRKARLLFPRTDGEMRTEADKLASACALLWAGPGSSTATCTSAGAASVRALHTKRSTPAASGAGVLRAGCSSGPRRCLAASACTTRGTRPRRCSSPPALTSTAVARILRHSDPKIHLETYAHLVPGYLHAQIDRLPKLETFAALVLQAPPEPHRSASGAASRTA